MRESSARGDTCGVVLLMKDVPGTIYLFHFERPYKHARHYLGWTTQLEVRAQAHSNGQGSRLMAAVASAGISVVLARTWKGTRSDERKLHRQNNNPRLCPICCREEK